MEKKYRDYIIKWYLLAALFIFIFLKVVLSIGLLAEVVDTYIVSIIPSQYKDIIKFAFAILFTSFIAYWVYKSEFIKKKIEEKVHDSKKRKKIFGKENFIEGEWFNATVLNRKEILEYAIIKIDYDGNVNYKINGIIYHLQNTEVKKIGTFKGVVQKYNECTKELDFSFKRESIYEEKAQNLKHHKLVTYLSEHHVESYEKMLEKDERLKDLIFSSESKCRIISASYGAGKYIFESYPHDKEPTRLNGEFYDPEKDLSMKIIGKRIRTSEEMDIERDERERELMKIKDKSSVAMEDMLRECKKVKDKYDEINMKRLEHYIEEFNKKFDFDNSKNSRKTQGSDNNDNPI